MTARGRHLVAAVIASALLLAGCSTPESKVEGFNKRGEALLKRGELAKAGLEFRNALQVNPSADRALFGLAVIAERSRDWRASYELLSKVVELRPDHVGAIVKLGKLQVASARLDKAIESAKAADALEPGNADVLGLRAMIALKLADSASAVSLARQALAASPQHVEAIVVLATERSLAGDAAAAVALLDRGLQAEERNVPLQMLKVQALEKLGRTDLAADVLRRLVVLHPDDPQYRNLLASFHVSHGKLAEAEQEYRAVIAAQPKRAAPKLQLVGFIDLARGLAPAAAQLEAYSRAEPKSAELKLALAGLRLRQKDAPAAIALWHEVIRDADTALAVRARGSLASHEIAQGRTEAARKWIAEMLEKDARDEQGLFLRAGLSMDERKLDEAVADLRTILRDSPDSARAHLVLAQAHDMQGLNDLATQHHASAAQAGRFAPAYALPYAAHLVRSGRARLAEGVLRDALRAAPGHPATLKLLADVHLRAGDVAAAQAVADQLAAQGGADALQVQGAVQLARKEYGAGIASFKQAYSLAPAQPHALASVVRGYLLAGKPAQALAFVQAQSEAAPQDAALHVVKGQLQAQTGDVAGAIETLRAATRRTPGDRAGHQALAGVYLASRDFTSALAAVDEGLAAIPRDFGLRVTRASVLDLSGRADEAIAAYEAMHKERPNAMIVANNLASLLADHRTDAASIRRAYDIAQRLRGSDIPHLKDTLGWTTHLAGRHEEAARLLAAAAAQAPDLAAVHYHVGMNQLTLNNVPAAKAALQRAIDLSRVSPFPQAEAARRTLAGL